jgi:hypothetical protein
MRTRQFIPALFSDNYIMQAADPFYLDRVLEALPGHARKDSAKGVQLAEGDWDINDGMMFGDDWHATKIITASDTQLLSYGLVEHQQIPWHVKNLRGWVPPAGAKVYGSVDYGFGAPFAFHLHGQLPGGHTRTFFEWYAAGVRDVNQAKGIRRILERLYDKGMPKPEWIVYDPQMDGDRAEVGLGSISDVYHEHLADPLQLQLVPGSRQKDASRKARIQRVKEALAPMDDGFSHWDITLDCPDLIRTLPDLPTDPDDPEDIDEDAEDHAYEGISRYFHLRPAPPRIIIPTELDELDPLSRAEQIETARRRGEIPQGVQRLHIPNLSRS